jgi:hypothetical protein
MGAGQADDAPELRGFSEAARDGCTRDSVFGGVLLGLGALGVNAGSAPCSRRLSQGGYEVLGYGLPPPWRTQYGHLLQERFRRLVNIGQISSIHT